MRLGLNASTGRVSWREFGLVLGVGLVLAVVMSWPLAPHVRTQVANNARDPLLQAWEIGWNRHALFHQPLHWFQANISAPHTYSLAFSDSLIGLLPISLLGAGVRGTIAEYNAAWLLSYALCFAGAYYLARVLQLPRAGAVVAGVAFAYAPYRWAQSDHLNILLSGGIPIALGLLIEGRRRLSPKHLLGAWLVAAWIVTVGWTLGIIVVYLFALITLVLVALWLRDGRPALPRRAWLAFIGGGVLFLAVCGVMAYAYLRVQDIYPGFRPDTLPVLRAASPPWKALLFAPPTNTLWGHAFPGGHSKLLFPNEEWIFPGLVTVLLAAIGLATGGLSRRARLAAAAGTAISLWLSIGMHPFDGWLGFHLLHTLAPGWKAVRDSTRFYTLTTLGLALLAGAGATALARRLRDPRAIALLATALGALILVEYSPYRTGPTGAVDVSAGLPRAAVVQPPGALASYHLEQHGPALFLPAGFYVDYLPEIWSTQGFPKIANTETGYDPDDYENLVGQLGAFPDAGTVQMLRAFGIKTVVEPLNQLTGTVWAASPGKPTTGLGIRRIARYGLVIYEL